jgi:transposase
LAVANKRPRILRAILVKGERFDPSRVSTPSTLSQPR